MKKYIIAAALICIAVFTASKNNISKKQVEYYSAVFESVNDEYAAYGRPEGKSIAVFDKHNNKIRLVGTDGYGKRYKFADFYKSGEAAYFEVSAKRGVIFTGGEKINIDKFKKLKNAGGDRYIYVKK